MTTISISRCSELILEGGKFIINPHPPGVVEIIRRNFGNIAHRRNFTAEEYYVNDRLVSTGGKYEIFVFKHCYIVYNVAKHICQFIDIKTHEVFKTTNEKYLYPGAVGHLFIYETYSIPYRIRLNVDDMYIKNCDCCRVMLSVTFSFDTLTVNRYAIDDDNADDDDDDGDSGDDSSDDDDDYSPIIKFYREDENDDESENKRFDIEVVDN